MKEGLYGIHAAQPGRVYREIRGEHVYCRQSEETCAGYCGRIFIDVSAVVEELHSG